MSETVNDGTIRSIYLTRNSIIDTTSILKGLVGRDVKPSEVSGLLSYMKEQNYNSFRGIDHNTVRTFIAQSFAKRLNVHHSGGYTIDTHELMKRNIGRLKVTDQDDELDTVYNQEVCRPNTDSNVNRKILTRSDNSDNTSIQDGEGFDNKSTVTLKNMNTAVLNSLDVIQNKFKLLHTVNDVYSSYVLLDSRYRKIEGAIGNPITEYKWEYTPTIYTTHGTANVISRIQDILYIQVQQFGIPYVAAADNVYKRVSMLIQEFSALAVIAHENRRYHLMFHTEVDGNRIDLIPPPIDEGRFRFSTPINKVDQLTISFGSPLTPIRFESDRYNITVIPINAIETQILFPVNHNINNGEIVILSGFTTAAPVTDEVHINSINNSEGHVVNVVNATTLSIVVDLTTITPAASTPVVECFITTRRVLIPIRMVYAHIPTI